MVASANVIYIFTQFVFSPLFFFFFFVWFGHKSSGYGLLLFLAPWVPLSTARTVPGPFANVRVTTTKMQAMARTAGSATGPSMGQSSMTC